MMKPSLVLAAILALASGSVGRAGAAFVVDFEATPDGEFTSYSQGGVTFTAVDGKLLSSTLNGNTPNGTRGLISTTFSAVSEIRAVISGEATSVLVDLGDYAGDADNLFLEAFDRSGVSIGLVRLVIPENFTGMRTLSLSVPGIASVLFGARNDPVGTGSSVYADNFTFETASVPGPSSLSMCGLASLAGLRFWSRRRNAVA